MFLCTVVSATSAFRGRGLCNATVRREQAAEARELKATVATCASQIQFLTLRNTELEADNARLRTTARQSGDVILLRDRRDADAGSAKS